MADAFTGSNYYKRSFTEYEVEACKRDATKRAQGCDECSLTEYEVEACKRDVADAHIFTAATAMAAKIERRAELDAEIPALEAEIAAATEAKTKRSAELDAEITELMVEIAAAKTKRNNKLAAMDAEITALEAELAAHRS
jgi:chromosome segregation ATPase